MIDETERRLDRADSGDTGWLPALDHDHLQTELSGDNDLGPGGATAGILRHDHVDSMLGEQIQFAGFIEGAAGENIVAVWHGERRIDRIDAAHEIAMLRSRRESTRFLPADGEEDAARLLPNCGDGGTDIGHPRPAVPGRRFPRWAAKREDRNARPLGCLRGIGRDLVGEGMRGVDDQPDLFLSQIINQPLDTSEAADPCRQGQGFGVDGAPGQRDDRLDILAQRRSPGQSLSQSARLGRATQNQDAGFAHG